MRRVLGAMAIAAMAVILSLPAAAHSPLRATDPADGSSLAEMPASLVFNFGRAMRLTRVTAARNGGKAVRLEGLPPEFAERLVVPFAHGGAGAYVIKWRGLSDDGHVQRGRFRFSVD